MKCGSDGGISLPGREDKQCGVPTPPEVLFEPCSHMNRRVLT